MPETIVITGGAGFVGAYLGEELRQHEPTHQLVMWDKVVADVPPGVPSAIVDITDPDTYRESLREHQPTWIVHLAGVAPVNESFRNPELTHQVNTVATRQLLLTARQVSPGSHFLVASSSDIYGQGSATPLSELSLDQAQPQSPYAQSKWEMERIIEAEFNSHVIRVRPFPHIGPRQRTGFVTADFASQIAAIESGTQAPVIKVGNLDAIRDFTDVRDVVRAYRLLLQLGQLGEVYHVASGVGVRIRAILGQLLALSTKKIAVVEDPARLRPVDISHLVGDARKLSRATGWHPEIPLTQSLRDTLHYWRGKHLNP